MYSATPGPVLVIQIDPFITIFTSFIISIASGGICAPRPPMVSPSATVMANAYSSQVRPSIVCDLPVDSNFPSIFGMAAAAAAGAPAAGAERSTSFAVLSALFRTYICLAARSTMVVMVCPMTSMSVRAFRPLIRIVRVGIGMPPAMAAAPPDIVIVCLTVTSAWRDADTARTAAHATKKRFIVPPKRMTAIVPRTVPPGSSPGSDNPRRSGVPFLKRPVCRRSNDDACDVVRAWIDAPAGDAKGQAAHSQGFDRAGDHRLPEGPRPGGLGCAAHRRRERSAHPRAIVPAGRQERRHGPGEGREQPSRRRDRDHQAIGAIRGRHEGRQGDQDHGRPAHRGIRRNGRARSVADRPGHGRRIHPSARNFLRRPPVTRVPDRTEAAEYYFKYIDLVRDADICRTLDGQRDTTDTFLRGISEERSLYRYAPDKWSIRQ